MTVRSPSSMIPGEWESRRPLGAAPVNTPIASFEPPAAAVSGSVVVAGATALPNRSRWIGVVVFVGLLLLIATLAALFGASPAA